MALAATDGMMDRTANYGYINRQAWHQGTPGPPQTHFCWPGSRVGRPGSLWVDLFSSWSAEREKWVTFRGVGHFAEISSRNSYM